MHHALKKNCVISQKFFEQYTVSYFSVFSKISKLFSVSSYWIFDLMITDMYIAETNNLKKWIYKSNKCIYASPKEFCNNYQFEKKNNSI